jgi:predicted ATPase
MRISSFEYRAADGWTLEKLALDGFNLLVGVSGAGKTRIVQSIEQVCALALGERWSSFESPHWAYGANFLIEMEHDDQRYRWEALLDQRRDRSADRAGGDGGNSGERRDQPWIVSERIWQGDSLLVERGLDRFLLNGVTSPRFSRSQSAIAALNEDPRLSSLYKAFSHCIFRNLHRFPSHGIFLNEFDNSEVYPTLERLAADLDLPLHHRADYMKVHFPDAFRGIEEAFRDAFPHVQELTVIRYQPPGYETDQAYNAAIAIREEGVKNWIFYSGLSSGMQRYLAFLFHLSFAPKGTVVLLDELESSLGVNCLSAATSFLMSRAPDLQLIITSHHPYIIEQIPPLYWKIVTRHGSLVRVLPASEIPALADSRTHLDRFTRLMNLPEYLQ